MNSRHASSSCWGCIDGHLQHLQLCSTYRIWHCLHALTCRLPRCLPQYLPGFVATLALIMINAVRRCAPCRACSSTQASRNYSAATCILLRVLLQVITAASPKGRLHTLLTTCEVRERIHSHMKLALSAGLRFAVRVDQRF